MSEAERPESAEYSLFAFGTTLLRRRRRIAWWSAVGGALAAVLAFTMRPEYVSTASFIPQRSETERSGLASFAGQLGVALPSANPSQSPDFYVALLRSPVLLEPIAVDTFTVVEMGGKLMPFGTLFQIAATSPGGAQQAGARVLSRLVTPGIVKMTGIVQVSVTTPWPSVSQAISARLVKAVDRFNQQTRREQAASERVFVEGRLTLATNDLRLAEDRLEQFSTNNVQFTSPNLKSQRDRLQREVDVRQQVFMTLTQAYEDVRIREVRDTPVITLIQSPSTPTEPKPRHRITIIVAGLLVGAFAATALSLLADAMNSRRHLGSREAEEFYETIRQMKEGLSRGRRANKG